MERAAAERASGREASAGAARARAVASGAESIVTIGNRIERSRAEIRRVQRLLETAGGTYRVRLTRQLDELLDQAAHDSTKLDAGGGVAYSRDNVQPGDFVRIRGAWYPVTRANDKTVAVPSGLVPATSRATSTTVWREVTDHLAHDRVTRAQIEQMVTETSPAFPGLRERLARAGESR